MSAENAQLKGLCWKMGAIDQVEQIKPFRMRASCPETEARGALDKDDKVDKDDNVTCQSHARASAAALPLSCLRNALRVANPPSNPPPLHPVRAS